MAAKLLEALVPHLPKASASTMASASAVARRAADSSSAPSSSTYKLYALCATEETLAAIRGRLAAAARRAAHHAIGFRETSAKCLPLPLVDASGEEAAPRLVIASASPTDPAGDYFSYSSATLRALRASSSSGMVLLADLVAEFGLGSERLASSPLYLPAQPGTSSSSQVRLPSARAFFLCDMRGGLAEAARRAALHAAGFSEREVFLMLAPLGADPTAPRLASSSSALGGLLLPMDGQSSRYLFPIPPPARAQMLLNRAPLRAAALQCRTFFTWRSPSKGPSPPKGPAPPPAIRNVHFLVALIEGMVLSKEDEVILRRAVDRKFRKATKSNTAEEILPRLEDKMDTLTKSFDVGNKEVLQKLDSKIEWGSIKVFGRKLDLTKAIAFVRALITGM